MGYIVTNPDGLQFGHLSGRSFQYGATIGEGQLPASLVERLLAEGAIKRDPHMVTEPPGAEPVPIEEQQRPAATRSAVAFAVAHDVDVTEIEGTGRDGRVTLADVRGVVEAQDAE